MHVFHVRIDTPHTHSLVGDYRYIAANTMAEAVKYYEDRNMHVCLATDEGFVVLLPEKHVDG
jgi:hypothetical protein